jgi:N-acetylglucosaminyl-diphospho-decaprenol L-rhamnosyltransferase
MNITGSDSDRTSVVIVNYRTKKLTLDAVQSALAEPGVCQVLVVDNGSEDGSVEFIRAGTQGTPTRVIEAGANLGFGRGVNLAVEQAQGGLLLLLNSDATLVPGAVDALAARVLADDRVGVVAPVVYEGDGQTPQPGAYGRFPRVLPGSDLLTRHRGDGDLAPDWVSGVAMMMRIGVFRQVGGFDPAFDMYLEDVDLCRRIRRLGRAVVREPAAGVIHLGGRSWGSSVEQRERFHRSKLTYFRKEGVRPASLVIVHGLRVVRVAAAAAAAGIRRTSRPRRR